MTLWLCSPRVHVDFQNNTVRPVGLLSSTVELEKLPPTRMFLVSITEVSVVPPPTWVNQ